MKPSWDDYFLGLAFLASRRSPDPHTQHGTVIADGNHHVIATGYNGFPRGMDDDGLPTTRPEKYAFFEHSETNALANVTRSLWDASATAYVTGKPCFSCLKALWRHNVRHVVHADRRGFTHESEREIANYDRVLRETGMRVCRVRPDLSWMFDGDFMADLIENGFIGGHPLPPLLQREQPWRLKDRVRSSAWARAMRSRWTSARRWVSSRLGWRPHIDRMARRGRRHLTT